MANPQWLRSHASIRAFNGLRMGDSNLTLLAPGSQLGPYWILELLGAGGMGQVYRAFDSRLHRNVAIKLARERVGERFDREVRTLAALNHPNICSRGTHT
jgi:hypothetical protein